MRIAVFGTGAVGGYFGARLARAGQDVTFIARGEHLRAMQENGLQVFSIDGDFVIQPVQATSEPGAVGQLDLILVGVKAWQVPEAARAMKPMVGPTTAVLPLQNGVEAPDELAHELGDQCVIGGLCKIVAFVSAPGRINHAGFEPSVTLGELDNRQTDRVQQIHDAFRGAGVTTTIATDIQVALWSKFLFITAFSGIGALTDLSAGGMRTNPEARGQLVRALEEVYRLARARGVRMPPDSVEKALANVDSLPDDAISSMHRDIAAGRPSELESQNGAVVRLARESGIAVPTHEFIYNKLRK